MTEDEALNKLLEDIGLSDMTNRGGSAPQEAVRESNENGVEFKQWQIGPNDTFEPTGKTRKALPGGVFEFDTDRYGNVIIKRIKVITDDLIHLPDNAGERVLNGMEVFWNMEHKYRKHGLLYKRGILLWGPPGSGKTATLSLLSKRLIEAGGIVVMCNNPSLTSAGLAALRRIEPKRRIICILEDIDEIIVKHGEHQLLALLDGENQVESIVMVATTNYPGRLGARIVNRPSRFDERILVGMPSEQARLVYLKKVAADLSDDDLNKWVKDTDQLSIAHLRELAAAVLCLGQDYDVVLQRLKSMRYRPKEKDGIMDASLGFGAPVLGSLR